MRRWMLMLSNIAFFAADLLYFIISTRYKSCLAFSVQRFISLSRNEYLKWQWGWEKQKVRYDVVATFRDHGSILICLYYNTWDKTWVRVRHFPLWSLKVNKEERQIWADVSSIKRQIYYHSEEFTTHLPLISCPSHMLWTDHEQTLGGVYPRLASTWIE